MKYIIRISLVLFLLGSSDGIACTSFSVCAGDNKVLYGMNFDYYPSSRLCFLIQPWMQKKVFHMTFDCYKGYIGKKTVGMNTEGLFANMQLLYPSDLSGWKEGPNTSFFWELYQESLKSFGSVKDVRVMLNERRLIQGSGVTVHSMFADKHGDALVVEAAHEGNNIINKKDKFTVMTNFPISDFVNVAFQKVEGVGSERYKAAYNYLLQNSASFCVDSGMNLLKSVVNKHPNFPTRCSFVFDPEQALVYVSLEGDFDKIWRVSINKSTIETWKGFQTHKSLTIGKDGIPAPFHVEQLRMSE
jgi:hypothetical protein